MEINYEFQKTKIDTDKVGIKNILENKNVDCIVYKKRYNKIIEKCKNLFGVFEERFTKEAQDDN